MMKILPRGAGSLAKSTGFYEGFTMLETGCGGPLATISGWRCSR